MLQIPFIQYPAYTKELLLDGQSYIFSFVWNTRGEFWTLSIFNVDKAAIINGIKIVLNYNLFSDYHHLAIPPGGLVAYDESNDVSKIKYEDFVNERKIRLLYSEVTDLVTI